MIVEVAIGVIIGASILRYESQIIKSAASLGVSLVLGSVVALALLAGISAIYWVVSQDHFLEKSVTILLILSVLFVGRLIFEAISRRSILTRGEVASILGMAIFVVPTSAFFVWFFVKWASEADQPLLLLGTTPIAALWVLLVQRVLEIRRGRGIKLGKSGAEA